MPLTPQELQNAATYNFQQYADGEPVDQITHKLKVYDWFLSHKKPASFTGGVFNEKVRLSLDSNFQRIHGADQLEFNSRDTYRPAPYQHYEAFDGFYLVERELVDRGITITRNSDGKVSGATREEAQIIVDVMKENWTVLKDGLQQNLAYDMLRDGTHDTKAVPGLDLLVSTTPAVGTIGGLDASVITPWQNYANMGISTATPGNLVDAMEIATRATITKGKRGAPDAYFCGSLFLDALRRDARATQDLHVSVPGSGGVTLDPSTKAIHWGGVPVIWDPTFDALDDILGAITYPWKKRCYGLNSKAITMRPVRGRWMQKVIPEPVYNRFVHYYGMHTDYSITTDQRSSHFVISIA
ncbi:MAG: phage major capsid protein [Pseudomonadota bacterium]